MCGFYDNEVCGLPGSWLKDLTLGLESKVIHRIWRIEKLMPQLRKSVMPAEERVGP